MRRTKVLAVTVGLCTLLGPVPAASAAPQPPRNSDTVGYFSDRSDCQWVGDSGRAQNRWVAYDCDRAGGMYRGMWQLNVRRYGQTRWPGGPNGNPHRPGWPGDPGGPGGPGGPGWPH